MKDLTGKRFGSLIAIKRDEQDTTKWICKCDCGNTTSVYMHNLTCGKAKSCGCKRGFGSSETKSTKCWDCKNISICEWSKGFPVPNWVATPSKLGSYKVIECPKFEQKTFKESKHQFCLKKANEMGVSERTVVRYIKNGKIKY